MATQFQMMPDGSKVLLNPGGGTTTINQPRPTDPGLIGAFLQGTAAQNNSQSAPFAAYAPSAASMFGSYADMMKGGAGTLGQMFDSYSRAYQGYGNTIGNIAANAGLNAANDNANRYGSWASGNASYQNMLGSLGAGALGAYGSAANAAMQAQAMRESAAMKMMSDALAANQTSVAAYGGQQAAANAALAKAYADAGTGLASGRGGIANAAATLGGAGSSALAGLSGQLAQASANASSGASQGQAALRAAIANSLSGLGVGTQNATAQNSAGANAAIAGLGNAASNAQGALGAANAAFGNSLANNISGVANNSMNYTRDMAKLDLARLLGVGQLNVTSQIGSGLGGSFGGVGGGGLSISGPGGQIASGSYGGAAGGGGSGLSTGQPPIYMQPSPGWYSSPQYYDAGGMSNLNALRDTGFGSLSGLAGDSRNTFSSGMDSVNANQASALQAILGTQASQGNAITGQGSAGAADINAAYNRAANQIATEGQAGRGGILDTLRAGQGEITAQGRGLDADSGRTFGGLDTTGRNIADSGVLDSLNNSYASSMRDMMSMYQGGRRDPVDLLREVYGATQTIVNPFLQAGKDAYGNFGTNFPKPLESKPGSFLDPMPYLSALQAGWAPFMTGLDSTLAMQNANVLGVLTSGQNTYNNSLGNLNNQFGNVMDTVTKPQTPTSSLSGLMPTAPQAGGSSFFTPRPQAGTYQQPGSLNSWNRYDRYGNLVGSAHSAVPPPQAPNRWNPYAA